MEDWTREEEELVQERSFVKMENNSDISLNSSARGSLNSSARGSTNSGEQLFSNKDEKIETHKIVSEVIISLFYPSPILTSILDFSWFSNLNTDP